MLPVETPFKIYTGLDGKPLHNGYVYFGVANQNPLTAPVTVYWDAAGTQPAAQPLRTTNGYIVRAGTPANVFFDGAYSELVKDSVGSQVFYARTSDDFSIATAVSRTITEFGDALQLADYAALRAYAGSRKAVYVTGYLVTVAPSGIAGLFVLSEAAGAVDNGGTVIVGTKKWARQFDGDLNAKWFGVKGGGVADDSDALQAAINAGVTDKRIVSLPADTYLITKQITLPPGAQLRGETGFQYTNGFGTDPKATTINFRPTVETSLFVAAGASYAGFRFHNSVEGLYINGNSATAVGLSKYAFDLDGVIYARFENIGIEGFQTGIRCSATINNRFCNVYTTGKVQAVLYAGNNETCDVWDQCSFWGSPVGITGAGSSVTIRFNHCLFEQLDNYGVNMARESQNWIFDSCYSEDVPFTNNAAGAVFRIGTLGVTLASQNHVTIIGGTYNGRNAGTVGSFVSSDYCNGATVIGVTHNRFTNIFAPTANTRNRSLVVSGGSGIGWTTYATDLTKIAGTYPTSVINSGSNDQAARFVEVFTDAMTAPSGGTGINMSGGALQFFIGATNAAWPTADNTKSFGIGSNRWSVIYAGTGAINTSDEREKQQIRLIDAAALRAWAKVEYCQFKFNDAVAVKGDGARWHFGVIAQRVKEAFESERLDAFAYGVLCFDKWDAADAVLDAKGQIVTPAREAGERYGIRYEEALVLECAYLRSRLS